MKIAIISDIHSNFEALESVLKDIEKNAVDEIISLGDNIGYGADPEKVIQKIKQNSIESVRGNHEFACIDDEYLITFNKRAKKALLINKQSLSKESLEYIKTLDVVLIRHNCRFVHGLPPDSVTKYVMHESKNDLARILRSLPEQISFVGHTHHLRLYEYCDGQINIIEMEKKKLSLDKNNSYIVNTGSVGQPRDHSIEAKYVIWDSVERTVEPRFIQYDNKKAADKIIDAGIPEIYSERVGKGKMFKQPQ